MSGGGRGRQEGLEGGGAESYGIEQRRALGGAEGTPEVAVEDLGRAEVHFVAHGAVVVNEIAEIVVGDGASASDPIVTHTYQNAGIYPVTLTAQEVSTAERLSDTETATIIVLEPEPGNQAPTARLTATPMSGEAPLIVTFDARASFVLAGHALHY